MKKRLLLSALTCGLLLGATGLQAKSDTKTLVEHQISNNHKEFKQAPKEILNALTDTMNAVQYLQHKKTDEAKKLLASATAAFDKALKENPALDVLPLDEQISVYENLSSAKEIQQALTSAQEDLVQYKLEEVRAILAPLKDEMDIRTTSLPMKLFPAATKTALTALNKGDIKKALESLADGFNTLIIEEAVLPLPLLSAQDLIVEASLLDKNKKEEASRLLEAAKNELKKAKVLGYTHSTSPEYKALNDAIDTVKKEIKGKNEVVKLYDELKNSFKALILKSKNDKQKKAEAKVNAYMKKEADTSVKDTKKFETEVKKDKAQTLKK